LLIISNGKPITLAGSGESSLPVKFSYILKKETPPFSRLEKGRGEV
jgi:hypothetical protein